MCIDVTLQHYSTTIISARFPYLMLPTSHSILLLIMEGVVNISIELKSLYDEFLSCSCMLQHKSWILGGKAKRNVGVGAAHQQEPQPLGAYMGFFMPVPCNWELVGHLDLVL